MKTDQFIDILLIEDNAGDVYLIKDMLSKSGINCTVSHASSLGEATKILSGREFDAVLLDLGLPESVGLETLERIKLHKIKSPVIVLTGLDDEEMALNAVKEGAQDYLVKGKLDPEKIFRAIRYSIGRKKIQEDLIISENRFRELNEGLELKVAERTKTLEELNSSLSDEIEERNQIEENLRHSEERYRSLIELSPNAVLVNRNKCIVLLNKAALELFGADSPEQILGKSPFELFHPDFHEMISERINLLNKGHDVPVTEEKIVRFDKTIRYVEVMAAPFADEEGKAIQVILHDITERKAKEVELNKLNRTLRALSKSNQAMAHIKNEKAFLNEICRIIINDCQYSMVWIGYAREDEKKTVEPVAYSGFEKGYLETLEITWDDSERGKGPTGAAIRTGKISLCKNMRTDPKFEPWRKEAIARGYESSVSLPLYSDRKPLGAMTIYTTIADAFSEEELVLLKELSNDLSYGIMAIRLQEARNKAVQALSDNEEKYRLLFDFIPLGITITDKKGNILEANSESERIIGISKKDHQERQISGVEWRIIRPDHSPMPPAEFASVRALKENKMIDNIEMGMVKDNDEITWLNVTAAPFPFREHGIIIVYTDVTRRMEAEIALKESEEKYRLLFNKMIDGFALHEIITNKDGIPVDYRIISVNPAFETMTGLKATNIIGKKISEVLPETEKYWIERYGEVALSGKSLEFEDYSSEINKYFKVSAFSHKYGYFAVIFEDITERKVSEEKLRNNAAELKELNDTKDKFFGIIAHDLKNPFASLLGATEILTNNAGQYDFETTKTFIGLMHNAALSGYALLENLLEWSRAQTGNLTFLPQNLNIREIVDENLATLKVNAANKKILLNSKVKHDIEVVADRNMLNTVIRNLLSNALKFTHEEGSVTVNAHKSDGHVIMSVKDTGVGIREDDLNKLFRLDIKYTNLGTAKEKGTGLGLLLCKEFIEKHGGKLWVESTFGKGSEFKFTVPDK